MAANRLLPLSAETIPAEDFRRKPPPGIPYNIPHVSSTRARVPAAYESINQSTRSHQHPLNSIPQSRSMTVGVQAHTQFGILVIFAAPDRRWSNPKSQSLYHRSMAAKIGPRYAIRTDNISMLLLTSLTLINSTLPKVERESSARGEILKASALRVAALA